LPSRRRPHNGGEKLGHRGKPTQEKAQRGATTPDQATLQGKIVEYALWLYKNGRSEITIKFRSRLLKSWVRHGVNLLDPEAVKEYLAKHSCSRNSKHHMVFVYKSFLSMLRISWEPPQYKHTDTIPFIPMETEIDQLIAACGQKTGTVLQLIKETGMRIGEAWRLKWVNVDFERSTMTLNDPEKNSNPRMFKVSAKLIAMLNKLPKKSDRVFGNTLLESQKLNFSQQRKRIAAKLENPRIRQISFRTLRHWKGTMEYHRTKDILHVKEILGHKNINSTLIYTHLVNFEGDEFHVRVAKTLKEACELAEAGFDYLTTIEGAQVFRKRK
jgi:integrase